MPDHAHSFARTFETATTRSFAIDLDKAFETRAHHAVRRSWRSADWSGAVEIGRNPQQYRRNRFPLLYDQFNAINTDRDGGFSRPSSGDFAEH